MYGLDVIPACEVGGDSWLVVLGHINYGMTYTGVSPYWQYIIKGSIIIFAVALDSMKYANKK